MEPLSAISTTLLRKPAKYIGARQRAHPPIYQRADGGGGLLQAALGFSPPQLQAMAAKGLIAGGEVGELDPKVYTLETGRGHAVRRPVFL